MKTKKTNSYLTCFISALLLLLWILPFQHCSNQTRAGDGNSTYKEVAISQTSDFTLENGIPVIYRLVPDNEIQVVQLYLTHSAQLSTPQTAGIENLMLSYLTYGSQEYTKNEIEGKLVQTSSSIGSNSNLDYSVYSMVCIDRYFEEIFDMYADIFLNPLFLEEYYTEVFNGFQLSFNEIFTDPFSRNSYELSMAFFEGHPYQNLHYGTKESVLDNPISHEQITSYYQENIHSKRLFIVVVSSMDRNQVEEKLNQTYGQLAEREFEAQSIPPLTLAAGEVQYVTDFPEMEASHLRGNFIAPDITDADFFKLSLSMELLNDLLYDIIRTKHNLAYSPFSFIRSEKANYGSLGIYGCPDPVAVKPYFEEAIDLLANGKCLSVSVSGTEEGLIYEQEEGEDYVPLENAIDFYKKSYITSYYYGQQRTSDIATALGRSYYYFGDYNAYLDFIRRIQEVTSQDIVDVVNKYINDQPIFWSIVANPTIIEGMPPDLYP